MVPNDSHVFIHGFRRSLANDSEVYIPSFEAGFLIIRKVKKVRSRFSKVVSELFEGSNET